MELFRQINQNRIEGNIFLHSMPGLYERMDEVLKELKDHDVTAIFCLTNKSEIRVYSPDYFPEQKDFCQNYGNGNTSSAV